MNDWIGPAVTATLISSLIAMVGWYVSLRTARRLDNDRRRERVVDVQTAILAEIRAAGHALGQYDRDIILGNVTAAIQANRSKKGYVPFVPREAGFPVFRAVIGEISILPTEVIDAVVLFYNQQQVIEHFAEDLRGARFADLPEEQKIQMLSDFLDLKGHALALAMQATAALSRSLGINIPDEARSVPKSASEA